MFVSWGREAEALVTKFVFDVILTILYCHRRLWPDKIDEIAYESLNYIIRFFGGNEALISFWCCCERLDSVAPQEVLTEMFINVRNPRFFPFSFPLMFRSKSLVMLQGQGLRSKQYWKWNKCLKKPLNNVIEDVICYFTNFNRLQRPVATLG